jgi:hypothetical protein
MAGLRASGFTMDASVCHSTMSRYVTLPRSLPQASRLCTLAPARPNILGPGKLAEAASLFLRTWKIHERTVTNATRGQAPPLSLDHGVGHAAQLLSLHRILESRQGRLRGQGRPGERIAFDEQFVHRMSANRAASLQSA